MTSGSTKVILQSTEDMIGQVKAAEIAMEGRPHPQPGDVTGVRLAGRVYGVRWNRGSVSVYPQEAPSRPKFTESET